MGWISHEFLVSISHDNFAILKLGMGPSDVSWFVKPMNYIVISTINHITIVKPLFSGNLTILGAPSCRILGFSIGFSGSVEHHVPRLRSQADPEWVPGGRTRGPPGTESAGVCGRCHIWNRQMSPLDHEWNRWVFNHQTWGYQIGYHIDKSWLMMI